MVQRFEWGRHKQGAWLYPARYAMTSARQRVDTHCHTYCEVFWIEEGVGWHLVGGERLPLEAGDCVFVRPEDVHSMIAAGDQVFAWTNVTLHGDAERRLRRRYEAELGWWPWDRRPRLPRQQRLARGQLDRLREFAAGLPVRQPRELDQEWFILTLLRLIAPPTGLESGDLPPEWLARAVRECAASPEQLQLGLAALVHRTGRCTEHVNRVVRQFYGMTTTDLIRHLRLEFAARQLSLTGSDILEVALSSGFENLSYFYRCFRRHYGTTPRRFRLQATRSRVRSDSAAA